MRIIQRLLRLGVFSFLVMLSAAAVVAACSDRATAPEASERDFVTIFGDEDNPEGQPLEPVIIWECPGGTTGEYPNCVAAESGCDTGICEPDPCASSYCGGEDENWEEDFCAANPDVCGGGEVPPEGTLEPAPTWDESDFQAQSGLPNCSNPRDSRDQSWCAGANPKADQARLAKLQNALDRMRGMGGVCANLAALGQSLLDNNRIRLFDPNAYPQFGATAPLGEKYNGWMSLSWNWTDRYHSAPSNIAAGPSSLQQVLAHELDHLMGLGHVTVNGVADARYTANSRTCDDL